MGHHAVSTLAAPAASGRIAATPSATAAASEPVIVRDQIPHITVHAIHATSGVRAVLEGVIRDRRLMRAQVKLQDGGLTAALALYREQSTPHCLIVECVGDHDQLLLDLDALAEFCDPKTSVIVIGHVNDIGLYRALMDRGVAEYIVPPFEPLTVIASIARLFGSPETGRLGQVFAFIGAKGGVGSSTVAQNVAWAQASGGDSDVMLADLDLPFGASTLAFNIEGAHGAADAVRDAARLDDTLLERLLTRRGAHMTVLASPATLDEDGELRTDAVEKVLSVAQRNLPFVFLDLPHVWSGWTRTLLLRADQIVVTSTPCIAGMRNAVSLIDALKKARPNDPPPRLALNQTGVGKRSEVGVADIETVLQAAPACVLDFDPRLYSMAENRGLMIEELEPKGKAARQFRALAQSLTGARGQKEASRQGFSLARLFRL
ncbi:MAG: CtpF protein [Rhodobacteraceae bacterium]|nr:MAG: CtpF protein [Paracoccaceae bacterium]